MSCSTVCFRGWATDVAEKLPWDKLLEQALTAPGSLTGVYDRFHDYRDRKSTRLNSSHLGISYAVFCLKKKTTAQRPEPGSTLSRAKPSRSRPLLNADRTWRTTRSAPVATQRASRWRTRSRTRHRRLR